MIAAIIRIIDFNKRIRLPCTAAILLITAAPTLPDTASAPVDSTIQSEQGYRIDQPGTITFTVGVKISGKVEKPQVMIFLPKEKTLYRDEVLSRSFVDELLQPLPFTPVTQ